MSSLRPCEESELKLTSGAASDYTGGLTAVYVQLRHLADTPCRLQSTLMVSIVDSDGNLAEPIEGNPFNLDEDLAIGVGQPLNADYTWGRSCGHPRSGLFVRAEVGGASSIGKAETPYCESSNEQALVPEGHVRADPGRLQRRTRSTLPLTQRDSRFGPEAEYSK